MAGVGDGVDGTDPGVGGAPGRCVGEGNSDVGCWDIAICGIPGGPIMAILDGVECIGIICICGVPGCGLVGEICPGCICNNG